MDYNAIITAIGNTMPEHYRTDPTEEEFYRFEPSSTPINLDPHKSHGALLPENFFYEDKVSHVRIGFKYPGKSYFPRALHLAFTSGKLDAIPHIMAYAFIHDIVCLQKESGYTINETLEDLMKQSRQWLKKHKFPIAHSFSKTVLPLSAVSHEKAYRTLITPYVLNIPADEAAFASAVTSVFDYIARHYRIMVAHHSESALNYAREIANLMPDIMVNDMACRAKVIFYMESQKALAE